MAKKAQRRRQGSAAGRPIDGRRLRLLGELLAAGIGHHGQVRVGRRGQRQALLQPDLPRRRIEQIDAAHHRVDSLRGVVNDDCQLVRVLTVGAQQYEVADGAVEILLHTALNAVAKSDRRVGHAQPPGARRTAAAQAVAAGSRVDQSAVDRSRWRAGGDFRSRAGARVDLAVELQAHQFGVIEIQALALDEYFAIPCEAEAFEGAQDFVGGAGKRPRLVDVLDAQQPLATVGAGVEIAADGGDQRTKVQRARR